MREFQQKNDLLHQQLACSEIYEEQNKDQLKQALEQQSSVQKQLEQIEEQWMEVSEELEVLQ